MKLREVAGLYVCEIRILKKRLVLDRILPRLHILIFPSRMISVDGRSFGRGEYFSDRNRRSDQYSYGWSFILATLGFLGSELSALLCLAAFLNRFDSEVRICKCNMNTVEKWNCLKV